ncbi:alpha-2-macroglobulin family protein [Arenibaculum sp.]|uniref:alpha-2-macroglobulin family protein n=1 Tax=Arenibaculum sp. TaxID=2865862 RepID=UPI002E0E8346|nr:MG2 domain-containing protein [Arenibaculum sp.]
MLSPLRPALALVLATFSGATLSWTTPAAGADPGAGFSVSSVEVVAERDVPQACFTFTQDLEKTPRTTWERFVAVEPAVTLGAVARGRTLCLEGFEHGRRYRVSLAAGLPGADGARLGTAASSEIEVPNRPPSLVFQGGGAMMSRIGAGGLPLRTINVERARLEVLRITDRTMAERLHVGRAAQSLIPEEADRLALEAGEVVWQGEMAIGGQPNQAVVTAFPIDALLGTLGPGVYVARAAAADQDAGQDAGQDGGQDAGQDGGQDAGPAAPGEGASRWFVVTELGLATLIARDGLVVFARTLADALPAQDVELRLVARNGTEIATARTQRDGLARFPPDVLDGTGALAPLAVFATGPRDDFGVVELAGPDFDLVDRIDDGARPSALVHTDRGIYRPGETVRVGILLRDADGRAVADARPVLALVRPDGFEVERFTLEEGRAGGFAANLPLPAGAATGEWTVAVHLDPAAPPLGTARLRVEDFVPPRIDLHMEASGAVLAPGSGAAVSLHGRYAYGAAAAGLHGELSITLRRADGAFPAHPDFRFGLAQETFEPARAELPAFVSGADGTARLEIPPPVLPETSHPLEAEVRAGLLDPAGGTAWATTVLPVHAAPVAIGIRPHFPGDAVPEGTTAAFDVVTLDPRGEPMARTGLRYDLFEEVHEPVWFETEGRWDYRIEIEERRLNGGTLDVGMDGPAGIELPVTAGRYRFEVFDPASGAASSVRFSAGWWVGPVAGIRPDLVEVTAMQPHYAPGETARVFVRPPYAGQVLITVTDGRIRHAATVAIGPEGEFLDIPLDPSWSAGVHVIATAFAPAGPRQRIAPRRATGRTWIGPEPWTRTLEVAIGGPTEARPRAATTLPITVGGLERGENAYVTVTAVDETVLHLTRHRAPDPAGLLLDRRPLSVELRDGLGHLIEPPSEDGPEPAEARDEPPALQRVAGVPAIGEPVVALFSGILPVGEGGTVDVPVEIPDFAGVLRVTAVAWSAEHMGMGGRLLAVGDPVAVEARVARRLAPGDETTVEAVFDVQDAAGDWRMTLSAEGVLSLPGGERAVSFPGLEPGAQRRVSARLVAREAGAGRLRVQVEGPDGFRLDRSWAVAVERPDLPVLRHAAGTVAPGAAPALPADLAAGLEPSGLRYTLSLGALPRLAPPTDTAGPDDVAALEAAIGTERLAAAVLPLAAGLPEEMRPAVQKALDRLLAAQRPDGAFGAWTAADPADPWLTAHALDVMTRAREAGLRVPQRAYEQGIGRLAGMVEDAWLDEADLAAQAYALYVLARARAIDPAEVRYFVETRFARLPTGLARAQAAAALGLLDDAEGARAAFAREAGQETGQEEDLRDRAGALALLAESGLAGRDRLEREVLSLCAALADGPPPGARETAWLRLADQAIDRLGAAVSISVDGNPVTADRPLSITFDPATPPAVVNTGTAPLHVAFGVAGHPAAAEAKPGEPPVARRLLDTRGEPVDPARLRPNQRVVVVLEGRVDPEGPRRLLATDTPSAGLVVERTRLDPAAAAGPLSTVRHQEVRGNRFAAVIELPAGAGAFRIAYAARAGMAGSYLLPPPRIEDADRPGPAALGETARIRVPALRVPVPEAGAPP